MAEQKKEEKADDKPVNLRLGDTAPNFDADTTEGALNFYKYLDDKWGVLFSHPADFTPVCTTELGMVEKLQDEFTKRNTKTIGLSCDSVESHNKWIKDIIETQGIKDKDKLSYPLIGDNDRKIAKLYGMLPASDDKDKLPLTVRSVYIVNPDKKIKLILTYPASTGRNFDEILRVIDSLQLTAYHKVATPANWKDGDKCVIVPSVNNEDAKKIFTQGIEEVKPYLRLTPQPNKK
mmetsp:Transcript_12269/g.10902  ORF Transcript_12269/g.10902 Transcript_12269/m.10902 type:complete len:234 (-) Transcript_12269:46-747(-)